ncbi:uncharacterized protein LOC126985403 isoform X1 [Eriocheir sinensis]|uniref:uncharacterized protein LOC126985403 isoform X1 n=1 Tax=Eriocheir sinensis TaxID=95602 RepID=UPI0021C644E7|nr:uncharacterized protein LOC126985403 isoform X1 [Eriocheir sinensis]
MGGLCRRQQRGQVKGGHVQGTELVSEQHSLGVVAWAVQQKVLNGVLDGPAPGAGRVGDEAQAVKVSAETCVAQAEARQGHVWDAGRFPHPRLWGGVGAVLAHGGDAEGVEKCAVPGGVAGAGDEAFGRGEWPGSGMMFTSARVILAAAVSLPRMPECEAPLALQGYTGVRTQCCHPARSVPPRPPPHLSEKERE